MESLESSFGYMLAKRGYKELHLKFFFLGKDPQLTKFIRKDHRL